MPYTARSLGWTNVYILHVAHSRSTCLGKPWILHVCASSRTSFKVERTDVDSRHFNEFFNETEPFLIIVSQIIKKFPNFYGTRGSVSVSQEPHTCYFLNQIELVQSHPIQLLEDPFQYYAPIVQMFIKWQSLWKNNKGEMVCTCSMYGEEK